MYYYKGSPRKLSDAYGTDHNDQPMLMVSEGDKLSPIGTSWESGLYPKLPPVCDLITKTDIFQRAVSTSHLTSPLLKGRCPLKGKERDSWLDADSGVLLDEHAALLCSPG